MQLTTGQVFAGRYRLLDKIGMGGFSEVWKVADEMAENRVMALKVYASERGLDEFGIKQFRREYSLTLDLSSTYLLKVNHFDIANGSPYLLMPYCEKGSLYNKFMRQGTLSEREVAKVLLEVAEGLKYLHENDIIHQDIKPDNVLIDKQDNYVLTDFGISSKLRSTFQKSTSANNSMTIAYAPPEKFEANSKIGSESDIFSVGVMLIELLTGDLPWNGMGGAYVRPDSLPPHLPEGFNGELNKLIQNCVQYNPTKRPKAAELKLSAESFIFKGQWPTDEHGAKFNNKNRLTEKIPKKEIERNRKQDPNINVGISKNVIVLVFILFYGLIVALVVYIIYYLAN